MGVLGSIWAWVSNPANAALVSSVGWGLSELLAQIPSIKANSVFQLIYGFFKSKQPPKLPCA